MLNENNNISEGIETLAKLDVEDTEETTEVKRRKRQKDFRNAILKNYDYKCCITGLKTISLLEAAHIRKWADYKIGRLNPANGLCINQLFHVAYDNHLVSISPDYVFHVHKKLIKCDPDDNFILQTFLHYDNKRIFLPDNPEHQPDRDFLDAHYEDFKRNK